MPVCIWVCALSFGRCRMSKFWLLVYLDFFESLRPALGRMRAVCEVAVGVACVEAHAHARHQRAGPRHVIYVGRVQLRRREKFNC